jgi:hypothetical protein
MNPAKRKRLFRIDMASQKVTATVTEKVPEVKQVAEVAQEPVVQEVKVEVVPEIAQTVDVPVVEVAAEALIETVVESEPAEVAEVVEESSEPKRNVLPKLKKYKKDVEVGQ